MAIRAMWLLIYYSIFQTSITLHSILKPTDLKKVLFLLAIGYASLVGAQSPLRLGAHFDPVVTWFSPHTSRIDNDGGRLGFNAGLLAEYYFAPHYAFASGFNLTHLGGDLLYKDSVTIITDAGGVILPAHTTVAYNITYLSIPVALKLKSNEIGYFSYYAEMGFTPQVNISSKGTSTGRYLTKDNVSKEFSFFNLSYFFGGGIEYNIGGQTALVGGLFYNNGFIDVLSTNGHRATFNTLTIRLGIMF